MLGSTGYAREEHHAHRSQLIRYERSVGATTGSRLLEAIYAAPFDDGARLVYADSLLERGEPLGEYVQLQVQRAARGIRSKSREQALFKHATRRWPPGSAWWPESPCLFGRDPFNSLKWEHTSRGFPVVFDPAAGSSDGKRAELKHMIGRPAWNLVEDMTLWTWWSRPILRKLLAGSSWLSLRSLSVEPDLVRDVASAGVAPRVSVLRLMNGKDLRPLHNLASFSALTALFISADLSLEETVRTIDRAQVPASLRALRIASDARLTAVLEAFRALPSLVELLFVSGYELRGARSQPNLRIAASAPDLIAAELAETPMARIEIDVTSLPPKQRPAARKQLMAAAKKWRGRVSFVDHVRWWNV